MFDTMSYYTRRIADVLEYRARLIEDRKDCYNSDWVPLVNVELADFDYLLVVYPSVLRRFEGAALACP